jgi:hypothetical protein
MLVRLPPCGQLRAEEMICAPVFSKQRRFSAAQTRRHTRQEVPSVCAGVAALFFTGLIPITPIGRPEHHADA